MTLLSFSQSSPVEWQALSADDTDVSALDANAHVIVPFGAVDALFSKVKAVTTWVGVVLEPADDVVALETLLGDIEIILLTFPKFSDGRAYSQARILRDRFGYRGEIRAVGDILVDQVGFMVRCGFDSMVLAPGVSDGAVARAVERYSLVYQSASDERLPVHKLRSEGQGGGDALASLGDGI
ncbi:MAG: DUF934 domain-containing protein [Pseudomonadota bacterium]